MSKLVRKTLDESPIKPAQVRKLARIAAIPEEEIDFSEIPPLQEKFWQNAIRNPFERPVKLEA